ncbi:MAG: efflux RND transporter periplasmic adaptor subunit [Verrucomicrobia bacterium]|nr:MAG: efflux RND transporter periplasmic adaptor subunit [Verrucomicrobiota bacterium]
MKRFLRILLPFGILAVAVGISAVLMATRKKPEVKPTEPRPTLVQAITASTCSQTFSIHTQGTVEPLSETVIIPEVPGRIIALSSEFRPGGFFRKGEVLIELDPSNYEAAVAQAEFNLAQARLRLEQERARAEQARKEWASLADGEPPPLAVRIPQLEAEKANVAWSEQALARARLDLERTKIRAPYDGMVREKSADLGSYVTPGTRLGSVFAIDFAEVRLPLASEDLAYLDLPYAYRGREEADPVPVRLTARIAGRIHAWDAEIVRTEGTIDPRNRMLYAVARIADPYGRNAETTRPPLHIGTFVEADIRGRRVDNVVVLPRQVLRDGNKVLVIDKETNELHSRTVTVLKTDPKTVVIGEGLADGELVCTTPLDFVVEGMKVEIYRDDSSRLLEAETRRIADTNDPDREGGAL